MWTTLGWLESRRYTGMWGLQSISWSLSTESFLLFSLFSYPHVQSFNPFHLFVECWNAALKNRGTMFPPIKIHISPRNADTRTNTPADSPIPNGQPWKDVHKEHYTDWKGYRRNIYVYTMFILHVAIINKGRGHELRREPGEVHREVWKAEMEGEMI